MVPYLSMYTQEFMVDKRTLISIVIPVYNNADMIEELVDRLYKTVQQAKFRKFEIIFVNDGSNDKSIERMKKSKSYYTNTNVKFRILDLTRNFGQLAALMAGYNESSGDYIISMSADLQDPPEFILELLSQISINKKLDLVIGIRVERCDPLITRITSKIAYKFLERRHTGFPKGGFDYFLMSKRVKNEILNMRGRFRFFQGEIMSLGLVFKQIPYSRQSRKSGKSGYRFSDRLDVFVTSMIDSSYRLIQFSIKIGFLIIFTGLIFLFLTSISYLRHKTPFSGFTTLISSILILGGLQIAIVSLIGEYVWRNYDILRNKPLYIIKDEI